MSPRLPTACPKPRPRKAPLKNQFSSIKKPSWEQLCVELAKARAKRKPIRKVNEERRAKRAAKFKARLSRADWKKLRLEVFARDGFRCTAVVTIPNVCYPLGAVTISGRCPATDEGKTGKGLVCDHVRYQRFGHELLEDPA